MRRMLVVSLLTLVFCQYAMGQKNVIIREKNVVFAEKDSMKLKMDIYMCGDCGENYVKKPETIIYVFGGGFLSGSKEDSITVQYCRQMAERGYTTIAIDYRLGMKGKKQLLIPYFISSHPGCSMKEMNELHEEVKNIGVRLEQVQDFTPTPMTYATEMFHAGYDPYTGEKVFVERDLRKKGEQKSRFFVEPLSGTEGHGGFQRN